MSINLKTCLSWVIAKAFIFIPWFVCKSKTAANNPDPKYWLDCSNYCASRHQYIFRATPRKFLLKRWNHGNRCFIGVSICDNFQWLFQSSKVSSIHIRYDWPVLCSMFHFPSNYSKSNYLDSQLWHTCKIFRSKLVDIP